MYTFGDISCLITMDHSICKDFKNNANLDLRENTNFWLRLLVMQIQTTSWPNIGHGQCFSMSVKIRSYMEAIWLFF